MKYDHIDLCSGIGGFALAMQNVGLSEPILFCEIEPFCQKVLSKHWPNVPIATDLKEIAHDPEKFIPRYNGRPRILTSGFPCQPYSVAGLQDPDDERILWPFISKIVAQVRPHYFIFENVPGLIPLAFDNISNDLVSQGFATTTLLFPTGASVGSPHKRERIFIIGKDMANPHDTGDRTPQHGVDQNRKTHDQGRQEQSQSQLGRQSKDVAHTESVRHGRWDSEERRASQRKLQSEERQGGEMGSEAQRRSEPRRENVAYPNSEPSRGREVSGQADDQRRRTSEAGRESIQSRDRSARTSNIEQSRENVAYPHVEGLEGREETRDTGESRSSSEQLSARRNHSPDVSNTDSQRGCSRSSGNEDAKDVGQSPRREGSGRGDTQLRMGQRTFNGISKELVRSLKPWPDEPTDIPRVAVGQKQRKDKLKALGNAVVVQAIERIALAIKAGF